MKEKKMKRKSDRHRIQLNPLNFLHFPCIFFSQFADFPFSSTFTCPYHTSMRLPLCIHSVKWNECIPIQNLLLNKYGYGPVSGS